MKLFNSSKGQTLIEALVALGAAVVVLSAITVAVISALNNVQYTKNQNQATEYAQQGMEIVRQIGQSDWGYFSLTEKSNKYCLSDGSNVLEDISPISLSCGQNIGIFVREVDIEQDTLTCSDSVLIIVKVSWSDGKCDINNPYCHTVKLDTCLSNHSKNVITP